ncbi:ferredoxin [Dactylosporangium sp. NPDC048998]|uniref:ferredoxin n=1 Tax=Dactylosporangium sp. NPDC048998 TaxID=3363976 RepID=UPI00371ACE82
MTGPSARPRATVDHDLCAGIGQCMLEAPGAFRFDEEGLSTFDPHGPWTEAQVRRAADLCPMGAIDVTTDG